MDKFNTLPIGTSLSITFNATSIHMALENWKSSYKSKLLAQNMMNNATDLNKRASNVVLLSFGSWDAAVRNPKYFAKYTTVILKQLFTTILDDPILSHVKFFVLTAPAWKERPDDKNKLLIQRKILQHNPIAAAMVFFTAEILKSFPNIDFLDYYAISISRTNEVVDQYHYLLPKIIGNKTTMVGPVGITAANLFLEKLCEFFNVT